MGILYLVRKHLWFGARLLNRYVNTKMREKTHQKLTDEFNLKFPPFDDTPIDIDWRSITGSDSIEAFISSLNSLFNSEVTAHLDKFSQLDLDKIWDCFRQIEDTELKNSRGRWVLWTFEGNFESGEKAETKLQAEKVLIFDTETNGKTDKLGVKTGLLAAQAFGSQGLYLWSHPELKKGRRELKEVIETISIGTNHLIIAHNSKFDYARVAESYEIPRNNLWFDTQSMAKAVDEQNKNTKFERGNLIEANIPFSKLSYGLKSASLAGLIKFYFDEEISKSERDYFVQGFSSVAQNFDEAMSYAIKDTIITFKLFQHIWPLYKQYVPHSISHYAHGCLASQVIGVNEGYEEWLENSEHPYQILLTKRKELWTQLVEEAYLSCCRNIYDPWTRLLPKRWYERAKKDIKKTGAPNILTKGLLQRLCYKGKPILPFQANGRKIWLTYDGEKIPDNLQGTKFVSYGNLDRKSIYELMTAPSRPIYSFRQEQVLKIQELNKQLSYYKQKIKSARNCPRKNRVSPIEALPHGAVTKRTTGGILATAKGNPEGELLHELRAMFGPHRKDWKIVYADFDSQESRIAAIFADNFNGSGQLASSLNSYIVFTGKKENGNDYHSCMTEILNDNLGTNMKRKVGKRVNLGLQYGMGAGSLARYLMEYIDKYKLAQEAARFSIKTKKGTKNSLGIWNGGLDSDTWNFYERSFKSEFRREPFLDLALSRIYQPNTQRKDGDKKDYLNLCNYFCQCGGVAILHLTIAITDWLFRKNQIRGCFSASIHDEVVFLAHEDDAMKAAWLFQIAHFLTWHHCQTKLGLKEELKAGAWFEDVVLGNYYRKDPQDLCITPTNPQGFPAEIAYKMEELCTKI